MKINYNVTGAQRKELTYSIGEVIGQVPVYAGMPTAAYHMVGGYTVSKTGDFTAEGSTSDETNARIIARLTELGYTGTVEDSGDEQTKKQGILDCLVDALNENAEEGEKWERRYSAPQMECGDGRWRSLDGRFAGETAAVPDSDDTEKSGSVKPNKSNLPRLYTLNTPRGEIYIAEEFATCEEALAEGYGEYFTTALGIVYGDDRTFALVTARKAGGWDNTTIKRDFRPAAADEADNAIDAEGGNHSIEMPLDGFTPEKIDNLTKLVNAKAPLLKAALGVSELPIQHTDGSLRFPWFTGELDSDHANAYATLISLLCKTAIKKKRINAKEKETYNSSKYAMRCFLLALGMIGDEYKTARKILLSRLDGSSSYANLPDKEGETGAEIPEAETV